MRRLSADNPNDAGSPPTRPITDRRRARMRDVLQRRREDVAVVLENVHDAHNASALLRSCDAFGVDSVALCYTNQVFPEISRGVAAQVQKWLQIDRYDAVADCVDALHQLGLTVYATNLSDDAIDYLEVDWTQPSAVVLGNEHAGCSEQMLAAADARITIPMQGFVESLNVSVAGAVLLAEIARQRRSQPADWSDAKQRRYDDWIARETRR